MMGMQELEQPVRGKMSIDHQSTISFKMDRNNTNHQYMEYESRSNFLYIVCSNTKGQIHSA